MEDAFNGVREEREIIYTIKGRKFNLIGHILCRKGLLKQLLKEKFKKG
jgi:hypothetical protein